MPVGSARPCRGHTIQCWPVLALTAAVNLGGIAVEPHASGVHSRAASSLEEPVGLRAEATGRTADSSDLAIAEHWPDRAVRTAAAVVSAHYQA